MQGSTRPLLTIANKEARELHERKTGASEGTQCYYPHRNCQCHCCLAICTGDSSRGVRETSRNLAHYEEVRPQLSSSLFHKTTRRPLFCRLIWRSLKYLDYLDRIETLAGITPRSSAFSDLFCSSWMDSVSVTLNADAISGGLYTSEKSGHCLSPPAPGAPDPVHSLTIPGLVTECVLTKTPHGKMGCP